jgi:hypothetical protein
VLEFKGAYRPSPLQLLARGCTTGKLGVHCQRLSTHLGEGVELGRGRLHHAIEDIGVLHATQHGVQLRKTSSIYR